MKPQTRKIIAITWLIVSVFIGLFLFFFKRPIADAVLISTFGGYFLYLIILFALWAVRTLKTKEGKVNNTIKVLLIPIIILIVVVLFSFCGRSYISEEAKALKKDISKIKRNVTTEKEILVLFGKPNEVYDGDNNKDSRLQFFIKVSNYPKPLQNQKVLVYYFQPPKIEWEGRLDLLITIDNKGLVKFFQQEPVFINYGDSEEK